MSEWGSSTYGAVAPSRRERSLDLPEINTLLSVTANGGVIDQSKSGRRDISAPDKSKYLIVRPGDVVYNTMRMWQGVSGYSQLEGIASPAYTVVSPDPSVMDGRFLAYLMKRPENIALYRSFSQGLVSDTWNLKYRALAQLPLVVPPLQEQRRIAEILDTIDETIQATERVIAKLEICRQGTVRRELSELCNGPLTTVESVVDEVTVGIVVRPTQYYVSAGIPMLRSANVREDGVTLNDLVYMSPGNHLRMAKSAVSPGDVLTVRTGYPGTTAVVPKTISQANTIDILVTKTGNGIDSDFLALWVNSDFGKGHVLARQGGLAQQHFNVSDMRQLPIPLIDRIEQRRLVELDLATRKHQKTESSSVEKLRGVRAGLAADLLSGRVRTVAS
jgi:type I restriction enzyme, S subunit